MVVRRRAARDFEQVGRRLCEVLDGVALEGFPRHSVSVRYATEHRCGVVVHGPGLSGAVSGTDPLKDGRRLMRCEPMDDSAEAAFSARVTQAAASMAAMMVPPPTVSSTKPGSRATSRLLPQPNT